MNKIYLILITVIFLSACSGVRNTFVRSAPEYEDLLRNSKLAILITPEIEVNTVDSFGKKERQYNYEDILEDIVNRTIISQVTDKDIKIKLLTRKDVKNNLLSSDIVEVKDNFDKVIYDLYANGAWPEHEAFAIDRYIQVTHKFYHKLGADLLVIVRLYSDRQTSGAMKATFAKQLLMAAITKNYNDSIDKDAEIYMMKIA